MLSPTGPVPYLHPACPRLALPLLQALVCPCIMLMLVTVLPLDSRYIHACVLLQITFLKYRNYVLFLPKTMNYEIKLTE